MDIKLDYSDIKFQENGKLKLLIIVGTRPEIIRLAAVINKCRKYFDCILAHTGQNYDYNLNGVFFHDLKLKNPDVYMDAVGDDLGATMGNIINASYKLMVQVKPDAVLVLGDTNSCLSVIGAKRLHIPIFHMEAGNRCFDECLPEETNRRIVDIISDMNLCYSEHARRYLNASGVAKERTYVTGSPMAEVLHENLEEIKSSDIHKRLNLEKPAHINHMNPVILHILANLLRNILEIKNPMQISGSVPLLFPIIQDNRNHRVKAVTFAKAVQIFSGTQPCIGIPPVSPNLPVNSESLTLILSSFISQNTKGESVIKLFLIFQSHDSKIHTEYCLPHQIPTFSLAGFRVHL